MLDHDNLEEFSDPINYDKQDPSDVGIEFYSSLAKEIGDPVLEIACGTGRVTIPMAQLGFSITGLDIVPGMLERARSKSVGLPTRWVEGDARTFELGERFRLIFMTGNAFQAFVPNAEQEALLQRVHAHLDDEGWFAFETRNPLFPNTTTREGFFPPLETSTKESYLQPYINVDGNEVRVSTTQVYDHVGQILHLVSYKRWYEAGKEHVKTTRTALRYTFPQELTALLHYNGFTLLKQYGDWNLEPLTATSPSIIVVCRKRG
ncbi:MAG: class I SAM-dependent methyltransferase [Chloroflexi bacterium]|nr:class I SAM-dependent methyltransferase [Chloroflexota bacterium]